MQPKNEQIWKLHLYVVGSAPNSKTAIRNLDHILEEYLPGHYELETIDILESPMRAIRDKVVAAPTLIKWAPPPACRMVGTLNDREKVLACLGLDDQGEKAAEDE